MSEEFQEVAKPTVAVEESPPESNPQEDRQNKTSWLEALARLGLGDTILRLSTSALTLLALAAIVILLRIFFTSTPQSAQAGSLSVETEAIESMVNPASIPQAEIAYRGIARMAMIHTIIPSRPRTEITTYTVQAGDTVFGIAEQYGLRPQTILWGNYYTLRDDPHRLSPGQELNILPIDGTYYEWQSGDGLNGVARGLNVTPEDIINYPTNNLDPATIGDYSNPNIKPGTWLIVPGGTREFISWSAPIGVTRDNPAVARQLGPGACGVITDGAVGYGYFIWPSNKHFISGFDYSPETNHRGIDIAGSMGEGLYAVDAGVIVYAGWNDWGYGNMVVIDHGNGWQSLYAHMSALNVVCGESVGQGAVIGAVGSTGRSSGAHLHFELMNSSYGKVNPWLYLPPP
ncbi:MAG: M23 family metallopeptidase [Anaerolineae bacterium]|nr:M23 family metallopeptidase [Anaerolineae bacterium]